MIKTRINHIQFNIDPDNMPFYKELMAFLGWKVLVAEADMLGVGDESGEQSLWFNCPAKLHSNDYDGPGMNHLGFSVPLQEDVNLATAYLREHGISSLFDTPRHRPEFTDNPENTYYQVMFETPDRILIEVVYTGPKQ